MGEDIPEKRSSHDRRKIARILSVSLLIGIVFVVGVLFIWRFEEVHPSTDDAYLKAHYVWIAPQVSGQVIEKYVFDNQFVKKGAPIFLIDPEPYRQELTRAQANLVLARHKVEADTERVKSAKEVMIEQKDALDLATQYYERTKPLAEKRFLSVLTGIEYEYLSLEARARYYEARAEYEMAAIYLGAPQVQEARIHGAEAELELARIRLGWTLVLAPVDGFVTQFKLRIGDVVEPGQRLFPFIESRTWWVQANFKESDIERIEPGMQAQVSVDMYSGRRFKGVVGSLSSGAAASFSLLPPQNTTGNWVKVTQRIPVRIYMLEQDAEHPYRMDASCEVEVNTKAPVISLDTLLKDLGEVDVVPGAQDKENISTY